MLACKVDEPNENPDDAGLGCSLLACGADDDPNENPDEVLAGSGASPAATVGVLLEEEPKLKPEGFAEVDPNENVEADGPLGEPFAGSAAPKENAVEGEVEGGFAPKEKLNDFAGVDVESALGSSGFEGVDEPKLNGLAGLVCSFSLAAGGAKAGVVVSAFFSVLDGAPKVKGEEPELEAWTVGTKPDPDELLEAGAAGFKKLKPPEGAEGGLGAEGSEAVLVVPFKDSCPGFQPDFWAISSICFVTC